MANPATFGAAVLGARRWRSAVHAGGSSWPAEPCGRDSMPVELPTGDNWFHIRWAGATL